jgi:hypothetical protein
MCIPCEQVPPPNKKCEELIDQLKVLMWIELAFAISELFNPLDGGINAFTDFFAVLMIYQGYLQLSFCNMVMFSCFNMYASIYTIDIIGDMIQDNQFMYDINQVGMIWGLITLLSLIFYCISFWYGYQAYKEFKAVTLDGSLQQAVASMY